MSKPKAADCINQLAVSPWMVPRSVAGVQVPVVIPLFRSPPIDRSCLKQQRAEGLVLGTGGNVFFHRQVGQKGLDLRCAHFGRVAHIVEVDVAFDPIDIGCFGADGVVFEAQGITHPVEQLSVGGFYGVPPVRFDLFRILFYNGFRPPHRSSDPQNRSNEFIIQKFSALAFIESNLGHKHSGECWYLR
jgi:hypothetical protein